jgi:hypothetical protein
MSKPVSGVFAVFHELGNMRMRGVGWPSMPEHLRSAEDDAGVAAELTSGRLAAGGGCVVDAHP